jgi:hypothetical protein
MTEDFSSLVDDEDTTLAVDRGNIGEWRTRGW